MGGRRRESWDPSPCPPLLPATVSHPRRQPPGRVPPHLALSSSHPSDAGTCVSSGAAVSCRAPPLPCPQSPHHVSSESQGCVLKAASCNGGRGGRGQQAGSPAPRVAVNYLPWHQHVYTRLCDLRSFQPACRGQLSSPHPPPLG